MIQEQVNYVRRFDVALVRLGFVVKNGEAIKNIQIMDAVPGKLIIKRHPGAYEFIYTMGNFVFGSRLNIAWLMDCGGSIEHTLAHTTKYILEGMIENITENLLKK